MVSIKIGIVIFMLVCSGFAIYSWDRSDDGVKILNDDDYEEIQAIQIKNPKTGEVWNSVEEFEHRDLKLNYSKILEPTENR